MSHIPCPHCGQALELIPYSRAGHSWESPKTFESSIPTPLLTAPTLTPGSDYYRKTPLRDLSFTTAVLIPGARALITGTVIGLGAAGLALAGESSAWLVTAAACGCGGLALVVSWFVQTAFADSLTHQIEQLTAHGPVTEEKPVPAPPAVKVELYQQGKLWAFADLPARPEPLKAFALAIMAGRGYSERTATACGLTQEEYKNLTQTFVSRGLAQPKHPTRPQQGIELTGARAILRSIAGASLPYSEGDSVNLDP